MRKLIFIFALLFSVPAMAQVAYEASSQGYNYGTSLTYSITLGGASSSRAVAVVVNSTAPTTATVGGVAMSLVGSTTSINSQYLYCVATNLTGPQNIVISYGGNTTITSNAWSATGISQTTPCNGFNSSSSYSSPISITITSSNGDLTFSATSQTLSTATTNQTLKQSNTTGGTYNLYSDIGPGTGTTTHTWTVATPNGGSVVGANFVNGVVAVTNPTFTPSGGIFYSSLPQSTTLATATSGAYLCVTTCTTNGCTPSSPAASTPGTCSAGTQYSTNSQSITLPVGYETLSCLGTKSGDTNSSIVTSGQFHSIPIISKLGGSTVSPLSGTTWAVGGQPIGFVSGGAVAVGGVSAPISSADQVIDWSGLSAGVAPTPTTMANSTHGTVCTTWNVTNTHSSLTGATAAHLSNFVTELVAGGALYTGAGTGLGLQYATGTGGDNALCTMPSTYNALTMGYWVETTVPNTSGSGNDYSLHAIVDSADLAYDDGAWEPPGSGATYTCLGLEVQGNGIQGPVCATTLHGVQVQPNTLYWLSMMFNRSPCASPPCHITFTNGSASISMTNTLTANQTVQFTTTGGLPTGFATSANYYVLSTGLSSSTFEVSATQGGAAITAGSAGSGTQTVLPVEALRIYSWSASTGLTQVGSEIDVLPASGFTNPVEYGEYAVTGAETQTSGYAFLFGAVKISQSGNWPLLP